MCVSVPGDLCPPPPARVYLPVVADDDDEGEYPVEDEGGHARQHEGDQGGVHRPLGNLRIVQNKILGKP